MNVAVPSNEPFWVNVRLDTPVETAPDPESVTVRLVNVTEPELALGNTT